jgi:CO/xanthine dehydrogenase Mo-binding subunit
MAIDTPERTQTDTSSETKHYRVIHQSLPRVDGVEKVTGTAQFGADYSMPGMLYARIFRSPIAHGLLKKVDVSKALAYPGVHCVCTADDTKDFRAEPTSRAHAIFARTRVLFAGQPIAAVVATSKDIADEALALIDVHIEELPPVLDPIEAMKPGAPRIQHEPAHSSGVDRSEQHIHTAQGAESEKEVEAGNVSSQVDFKRGDIEQGFAEADVVFQGTFRSASVHQGYIEPHGGLAYMDPTGNLTMWMTSQGQFHCRDLAARVLGIPISKVRVIGTEIGGGFGAKFGLIVPILAVIARKARRPVKLQLTRAEEMTGATPAPLTITEIKLGAKRDGTITALEGRVVMDTGAYPGAPMSIGTILVGANYKFPNLRLQGYEVLTNKASVGAYRAPGAPNTCIAIEGAVDELASQLNMDPLEFRLKNVIKEGDKWPNGNEMPRIGLAECLEALYHHPSWKAPLERKNGHVVRGRAVACGGWPGGGNNASAVIRGNTDGTFQLVVGTINLTGSTTSLAQIAAEELSVDLSYVSVLTADTSEAPFGPASGGSTTTYSMAFAVKEAALAVRKQLTESAAAELGASSQDDLVLDQGSASLRSNPEKRASYAKLMTEAQRASGPVIGEGRSKAHKTAPGYSADIAEVEVDTETGMVTLTRFVGVQDVGFAFNPLSVHGQLQGGMIQGAGMALTEEIVYGQNGRVSNAGLLDYRLLTAPDVPMLESILVEVPSELGPYGARIVGEPSIVPPGAAVINAISNALGKRCLDMLMSPERVLWLIKGKHE